MIPTTHNDALRLQLSAADVASMRTVGTLPGVTVAAVAAANGKGIGYLSFSASGATWQAPGGSPGGYVEILADGEYMLEDGLDPSKWIRITAYFSYMNFSAMSPVFLDDSYNVVGLDDINAADALAGLTTDQTFTLKNVSTATVSNVKAWIDSGTSDLEISLDGSSYFYPTSEFDVNALAWTSIDPGASVNLYVRRTISAATPYDPKVLNNLQFSWFGY